jgi:CheY-like chemotaxis protein
MSAYLNTKNLLLADDDADQRMVFQDILNELSFPTTLRSVFNGEQLMQLLNETKDRLPDILFLDLNMPQKNGFTCLLEIKRSEKLKSIVVVIFSSSYKAEIVNLLYENGAQFYVRKPNSFTHLKKLIHQILTLTDRSTIEYSNREKFVLS